VAQLHPRAWRWTGLLLLALCPRAGHAGEPGFTAGADVVIVSGLPGDVETERAYQAQLARLLEVVAGEGSRPAQLTVLADAPQAVTLPAGLAADVKPATREALVELTGRLAGGARPLVVVAWGHGGMQGSTAVFHVRGPRVMPRDLAVLAAGRGASRWVLLFRGSGAFARALQGKGRTVLA